MSEKNKGGKEEKGERERARERGCIAVSMSLTYIENSIGPTVDPWGAPYFTSAPFPPEKPDTHAIKLK